MAPLEPHSAVSLDTVTYVNSPLCRNTSLGLSHVLWQLSLLWNPTRTTVLMTFVLPRSLVPSDFTLPLLPIHLLLFQPVPQGACSCPGVTEGRGAMVLTSTIVARQQSYLRFPQLLLLIHLVSSLFLLSDERSTLSTLVRQEGQDSFHKSECADDVGHVNNEKKSSFLLAK